MCWFDLVRKMWEFLATSHPPIAANDSLANKSYLCVGLLANLADILRPVDVISIILGIFDHILPSEMVSHWACWMIVERKKLSLNLMCLKLSRNMDVRSIQRLMLPF